MSPVVVIVDPELEYSAVLRVAFRTRKPPQREPRWISETNPTWAETARTGLGAELPKLLLDEQLAKVLANATRLARGKHVLYVSLQLGSGPSAPRLATWSVWGQRWSIATLELRGAS